MKIKKKSSNSGNIATIKKTIISSAEISGSLREVFYDCWTGVAEEFKDGLSCDIDSWSNHVIIRIHDGLDDGNLSLKPWFSISLSKLVDEVVEYEDESSNVEIIKYRNALAKDMENQAKRLRESASKLRAVLAK